MINSPIHTFEQFPNGYKVDQVTVRQDLPKLGLTYVFSLQIRDRANRVVESLVTTDFDRHVDTINYWRHK